MPPAQHQSLANPLSLGRGRKIVQRTQKPQAHGYVAHRIVTDLLESCVEQMIEVDPGNDDAHNMRRIAQKGRWRCAPHPTDQDPGQLIDTVDCWAWIVDRGRYCL